MDGELSRALTRTELLALDKLKLKWKELSVEVNNLKKKRFNFVDLKNKKSSPRTLFWMDSI